MTNDEGRKPEGTPERSPKAGAGVPSGVDVNWPKRNSVRRKLAVVARLLRGEPLELVARETNVTVAKLTEWRGPAAQKRPGAALKRTASGGGARGMQTALATAVNDDWKEF